MENQIQRKNTRKIMVGNVQIGGQNKVVINLQYKNKRNHK